MSPEQRVQMRARIAHVAAGLFKDSGYTAVSMRRIAKELGCTPMAIYSYYDSKIDILRTLWDEIFKTLFDRLDTLPPASSARAGLLNLGAAYVKYWLEHPEHYRLVFMSEGVTQPEVSMFLGNTQIIARYNVFLDAIQKAAGDELDDENLAVKLDFFLSTLHGIAHNHITISGYDWSAPEQQIEYAVRAISGQG